MMSGKRRQSSGSSRCDLAGVIQHLECIREALTTPSSEEMANKGMKGRTTSLLEATSAILDLVKDRAERKVLASRSSHGLSILFDCLKSHSSDDNSVIINILRTLKCLSEHQYKTRLASYGAVDSLLQSVRVYSESTQIVKDEVLLEYLSVLLQLSSKDVKFAFKARQHKLLPTVTSLLRRSVKRSQRLPVILSIIRILANNSTNSEALGKLGCMGAFPTLLGLYGSDYNILKYSVKSLISLLRHKSNARRRHAYCCIPELIQLVQKLHHTDIMRRHIPLRKSMILALSVAVGNDSCMDSFHKANGLNDLYHIARELHEDTRLPLLATVTCNLIRKCLPVQPLPLSLPASSLQFPLDQFKGMDCNSSSDTELNRGDLVQEDEVSPSDIKSSHGDITGSTSLTDICSNEFIQSKTQLEAVGPIMGGRDTVQSTQSALPRGIQSDRGIQSAVLQSDRGIQPVQLGREVHSVPSIRGLYSEAESSTGQSDDGMVVTGSSLELMTDTQCSSVDHSSSHQLWFIHSEANEISHKFHLLSFNGFFPEVSPALSLKRSVSLPTVSTVHREASVTESIGTSYSASSVERSHKSSSEIPAPSPLITPRLIASSRTVCNPLVFKDSSLTLPLPPPLTSSPDLAPFYKKTPSVDREILLMDAARFIDSKSLLNRVVYDNEKVLKEGDTPIPAAAEANNEEVSHLTFKASDESCNLRMAIQVREYEYDLILNADINTDRHHQWFLFQVTDMEEKVPYRFNIINCEKANSQFNYGMQPVLYSSISKTWERIGTHITYYRNNYQRTNHTREKEEDDGAEGGGGGGGGRRKTGGNSINKRYFTATFTLSFPSSEDVCYLSYHYPYTYSMLKADLLSIERRLLSPNIFYRRQSLCNTLGGHSCPLLTITNLPLRERGQQKEYVVLTGRVHPGESNSSWIMKGVIEFLTSSQPVAKQLRDKFVFKIIPMLNPDGVINGNHRCSLSGQDLNRQWISPDPLLHPTIYQTKGLIQWLVNNGTTPYLYCDFHGHSRRKNIFLFGCRDPLRSCVEEELPLVLDKLAPLFSIQNCSYVVEKSKEATARVVVWRRLGVKRSYTMESTYCGTDQGPLEGYQIDVQHLKEMGQLFCIGLHKLREGGITVPEHKTSSARTKKQSKEKLVDKKKDDDDDEIDADLDDYSDDNNESEVDHCSNDDDDDDDDH